MNKRIYLKSLFRNFRDGGLQSAHGFVKSSRIRKLLPKIQYVSEKNSCEVHVLLGSDRIDMALWMITSWVLETKRRWNIVFHDDGTLSQHDKNTLVTTVENSQVIMSSASHSLIKEHLKGYPLCWECRNLHPLSRKIFDVPYFSTQKHFLSIDTDVLFHGMPSELVHWSDSPDQHTIYMQDVSDNTLPEARAAAKLFDCSVVGSVNTGIIAIQTSTLDLPIIEECLRETDLLDADPWFIEQSLYAVMASLKSQVKLLDPEKYEIPIDLEFRANSLATHYIGMIRHSFYSNGIPKVIAKIKDAEN